MLLSLLVLVLLLFASSLPFSSTSTMVNLAPHARQGGGVLPRSMRLQGGIQQSGRRESRRHDELSMEEEGTSFTLPLYVVRRQPQAGIVLIAHVHASASEVVRPGMFAVSFSHLLLQSRREGRWMEETLGDLMYLDVLVVHDVVEGSVMQDIANAAAEAAVNGLERLEGSKGLSTALGGSIEQCSLTLRDPLSGPGCVGVLRDCLHEVGVVDGVKDASGRWHCVTSMHTPAVPAIGAAEDGGMKKEDLADEMEVSTSREERAREWELSAEAQVDDPEHVFVSMGPEDVRQTPRPLKLPSPHIAPRKEDETSELEHESSSPSFGDFRHSVNRLVKIQQMQQEGQDDSSDLGDAGGERRRLGRGDETQVLSTVRFHSPMMDAYKTPRDTRSVVSTPGRSTRKIRTPPPPPTPVSATKQREAVGGDGWVSSG
mmetsp:Transcript_5032/g.18111  ORF Transcript_5032/g.18111 Transcript_5032/m.18111 type:complete len:429 (-) Transcript_5032:16-1302(-)